MLCLKITDKYKHIYKYPDYQIAVGRNSRGNDHIIEYYSFVKERCYWFHLDKLSGEHIILYLEKDLKIEDVISIFKDIKMQITSKKKGDVMFCRLSDVNKLSKPGLVTCNNRVLMSDSNWVSLI